MVNRQHATYLLLGLFGSVGVISLTCIRLTHKIGNRLTNRHDLIVFTNVMQSSLTELAILGFISYSLYIFIRLGFIQVLNDRILGQNNTERISLELHPYRAPPTVFTEIFEEVHVFVFAIMVIYLKQCALMAFTGYRFLSHIQYLDVSDPFLEDALQSDVSRYFFKLRSRYRMPPVSFIHSGIDEQSRPFAQVLISTLTSEYTKITRVPLIVLASQGLIALCLIPLLNMAGPSFAYTVVAMTLFLPIQTFFLKSRFDSILKSILATPHTGDEDTMTNSHSIHLDTLPVVAFTTQASESALKRALVPDPKMSKLDYVKNVVDVDGLLKTRLEDVLPGHSFNRARRLLQLMLFQHTLVIAGVLKSQIGWRGASVWWSPERRSLVSFLFVIAPYLGPLVSLITLMRIFEGFIMILSADAFLQNRHLIKNTIERASDHKSGQKRIGDYLSWMAQFSLLDDLDLTEEYETNRVHFSSLPDKVQVDLVQAFGTLGHHPWRQSEVDEVRHHVTLGRSPERSGIYGKLSIREAQFVTFLKSTDVMFDATKSIVGSAVHRYYQRIEKLESVMYSDHDKRGLLFLGFFTMLMLLVPHFRRQLKQTSNAAGGIDVPKRLPSLARTSTVRIGSATDIAVTTLFHRYGIDTIDAKFIMEHVLVDPMPTTEEAMAFVRDASDGGYDIDASQLSHYIKDSFECQ